MTVNASHQKVKCLNFTSYFRRMCFTCIRHLSSSSQEPIKVSWTELRMQIRSEQTRRTRLSRQLSSYAACCSFQKDMLFFLTNNSIWQIYSRLNLVVKNLPFLCNVYYCFGSSSVVFLWTAVQTHCHSCRVARFWISPPNLDSRH